jgi:hypothetical protein
MNELNRRLVFLLLLAAAFLQTGAHMSQAFVNYPAWGFISMDSFPEYHREMSRGARLLLLARVVELVLAIVVLRFRPAAVKRSILVLAIALALCAFLSTVLIQRPIHVQLETVGNTPELLSRLRITGWFRLIPEWLRAILYLRMMSLIIRPQVQAGAVKTEILVNAS